MSERLPIFATRLRAAREASSYSQRGLGIAMGLDPGSASPRINQYEQGKREPDVDTAMRLANLLQIPLAYLYCEDDELAGVIAAWQRMSRAERGKLVRAVAKQASPESSID